MAIELPKKDFELVPESENSDIEAMEKAETQVSELVRHLAGRGFYKAVDYLDRSRRDLFSYSRSWLPFGIACPRASSLIERFFRKLGRRFKKLGYNWKPEGVGTPRRIFLKKCTRPEDWKKYWEERMRLDGSVQLVFRVLSAISPSHTSGHCQFMPPISWKSICCSRKTSNIRSTFTTQGWSRTWRLSNRKAGGAWN